MHPIPRRLPTRTALPVLLALAACAALPPQPADRQAAVLADRVIDEVAAAAVFNGAVVLMRDGRVVHERAVGLAARAPDRPFTVDTPSDGGSLAKTLTAALLWELAAEGRLSLDDPVTRHLPDHPYAGQTLRDLLAHRNGLPDYGLFEDDLKARGALHTPDLLALTAQRQPQPVRPPGVTVEYSNLGFDAAALVAERVTGRGIAQLWRERYFAPLGLQGMFARPARFADFPVPRTRGYRRDGAAWVPNDAYDGEGFVGASNVHASARDWARWGDAFARGRVMPRARLEAGLRAPMLDSGMDNVLTMLSWYCDAARVRCHYTGAYNGFYAQVWWDRARREAIAYVGNSSLPAWRCARLTRDLIDALAGRAPAAADTLPPRVVAKADLPALAGRWQSPTLGPLELTHDDGRLYLRVGSGELASVFQAERTVFYVPTLDLWLAFTGPPDAPTMHIRSVFHVAEATRLHAAAPTS
jgi:CubicO group peptidase (beta-lactamase class C family)